MDHALFLEINTIQNLLSFLERQDLKPLKLSKSQSSNQIISFWRKIWITPSEWEQFSVRVREASSFVLDNWEQIPEKNKSELINLSGRIISTSSRARKKDTQSQHSSRGLFNFFTSRILLASLEWASFRLGKDVVGELSQIIDDCSRDILEKADIIPGWNTTRTLVLSNKARDAFLNDVENPPEPPPALISGMSEFWEQYGK